MSLAPPSRLTFSELARRLRDVDAGAILVPGRIMRRIIRSRMQLPRLTWGVPHRKTYVIGSQRLLEIVDRDELGYRPGEELPETLHLVACPQPERLGAMTGGEALVAIWRLLFHLRVHTALDQRAAAGQLDKAAVRRRIEAIGQVEFNEIRSVLQQEHLLLPPGDEQSTYVEFAAVYLELRHFSSALLPHYFPSLGEAQREKIDRLLAEDIDAERLFSETRLEAAPDLVVRDDAGRPESETTEFAIDELLPRNLPLVTGRHRKLLAKADKSQQSGNLVRAAVLRSRAAQTAPASTAQRAGQQALSHIEELVDRLTPALEVDERNARRWRRCLLALLAQTPRGSWTPEARILQDLQDVCFDFERDIYTVDLVEWAVSLGKRPIKRPLPSQRDVLMCRHLRRGRKRLRLAQITAVQRERLAALMDRAVEQVEQRLRDRFRSVISRSLDRVGLLPANPAEQVAKKKLIEELLDRIVQRGFITIGDLRDALSRNQLKLPDRQGTGEAIGADQLLKLDTELFGALDGVYRGGEFYLRGLQRVTAVAFGTPLGRWLTRFVALPFGGAYLILAFIQYMVIDKITHREQTDPAVLIDVVPVLLFGILLLGLLYHQRFRRFCADVGLQLLRGLRAALLEWPRRLLELDLVQKIRQSRAYRLAVRLIFKPLALACVSLPVMWLLWTDWPTPFDFTLAFVFWTLLLNSRVGRSVEEVALDWSMRGFHRFRIHVLAELFHLVVGVSREVLESVERVLYGVDEWLRYRAGESNARLVLKAILGIVWFYVTFVVRFCVNLLIEPQINPIKHFPVVTVSHKLLFPTAHWIIAPGLIKFLKVDATLAETIAYGIVFTIPGIFGFLAWELKENWRIFAANRPSELRPVIVGEHGESMLRLLRPGFRSGTIPKRFKRLRRADRKAQRSGNWKDSRKHREVLAEVRRKVRQFTERELLATLAQCEAWQDVDLAVDEVSLGANSAEIKIIANGLSSTPLVLLMQERGGLLLASVREPGWLGQLSPTQRETFTAALAGFYKLAGVQLVGEQISACFTPERPDWEVTHAGLTVWPADSHQAATLYELDDDPPYEPRGDGSVKLPLLDARQLFFSATPITWSDWIACWSRDSNGQPSKQAVIAGLEFLPPAQTPGSDAVSAAAKGA
ncbi:MAG: hypothetical protein IIA67_01860 [Planctomycetes bacterium]|nr:hypothetical protein [Planctomycetota bacterium]